MIFGNLITRSNFNDAQQKVTSGRAPLFCKDCGMNVQRHDMRVAILLASSVGVRSSPRQR